MKTNLLLVRNGLIVVLFLSLAFSTNAQKVAQTKINITNFQVVKEQNKVVLNGQQIRLQKPIILKLKKVVTEKTFKTVAYVLGADPTKLTVNVSDVLIK